MRRMMIALSLLLMPLKAHAMSHLNPVMTGTASYYSRFEDGRKTASGQRYNPFAMTAASKTIPLGSLIKVINIRTGKSVILTVNDRGPYSRSRSRILDVSLKAAHALDMMHSGIVFVRVIVLSPQAVHQGCYG